MDTDTAGKPSNGFLWFRLATEPERRKEKVFRRNTHAWVFKISITTEHGTFFKLTYKCEVYVQSALTTDWSWNCIMQTVTKAKGGGAKLWIFACYERVVHVTLSSLTLCCCSGSGWSLIICCNLREDSFQTSAAFTLSSEGMWAIRARQSLSCKE